MGMKRLAVFCLALIGIAYAGERGKALPECRTLDACLARLHAMARQPDNYGSGKSPKEGALIRRLVAFDGAVAALVPLLDDPDENVANIAAAALRDVKRIDPAYLPQIRKGLDRGLGWLPPALSRMDSDEAAKEAVSRFLVSKSAPGNQEAYAVELSGMRAIPYIVDAVRCDAACGDNARLLGSVLADMSEEARASAAPGLMDIARDVSVADEVAGGSLGMIADLGAAGSGLEADLLRLRAQLPQRAWMVDHALIGIRSAQAGAIFAAQLRASPDVWLLRDLAVTGPAAIDAGEVTAALLDHDDPDLRVAAARALGFIGYRQAAGALAAKLDDPVDPRLGWAAAESLGRLQAAEALPALDATAQAHWFPPVRKAAAEAARHIRDATKYEAQDHPHNFSFGFSAYNDIRNDRLGCEKPVDAAEVEPATRKLYTRTALAQLMALTYSVVEELPPPPGESDAQAIDGDIAEDRKAVEYVPAVALRVDGGWLAGSSRGEWGGELVFVGDDGSQQEVIGQNVEDIYRLGDRYVATVGLAHLSINRGAVLELRRDADGHWQASLWRVLPGAPQSSFLTRKGDLLVTVYPYTPIVVSRDGTMRMAACAKYLKPGSRSRAKKAADAAMKAAEQD